MIEMNYLTTKLLMIWRNLNETKADKIGEGVGILQTTRTTERDLPTGDKVTTTGLRGLVALKGENSLRKNRGLRGIGLKRNQEAIHLIDGKAVRVLNDLYQIPDHDPHHQPGAGMKNETNMKVIKDHYQILDTHHATRTQSHTEVSQNEQDTGLKNDRITNLRGQGMRQCQAGTGMTNESSMKVMKGLYQSPDTQQAIPMQKNPDMRDRLLGTRMNEIKRDQILDTQLATPM